jgi:hypothetical protein
MPYPRSIIPRSVLILSTPPVHLGFIAPFFFVFLATQRQGFPFFFVGEKPTVRQLRVVFNCTNMCSATAYIGHPYTLTQCFCLIKQQIQICLVHYSSAPNTLPWSTRSRKRIGEADPPFAPTPVGEGASLRHVPTRKRLRSPHRPQNQQPFAAFQLQTTRETCPHMRGPTFPYHAVQVRTPSPSYHVSPDNLPAHLHTAYDTPPARPYYGTIASHRRQLVPRAGFPS